MPPSCARQGETAPHSRCGRPPHTPVLGQHPHCCDLVARGGSQQAQGLKSRFTLAPAPCEVRGGRGGSKAQSTSSLTSQPPRTALPKAPAVSKRPSASVFSAHTTKSAHTYTCPYTHTPTHITHTYMPTQPTPTHVRTHPYTPTHTHPSSAVPGF